MLLFHSHPRPLYSLSSRPGLLSRPIPRNPDCTQPSVSRFVGSILQPPSPPPSLSPGSFSSSTSLAPRLPSLSHSFGSVFFLVWPPIFHVSLRLRVAPLFSIGTFSLRWGSGGERAIRADPTYARHLKNSAAPLAEVAFSFDSLPSPSRTAALSAPRLAKCRPERHRLVEVADAIRAESAPLRGERDDSGNQVGNCLGLCAARYSHRGTPLAHTIARRGWYSLYTHTYTRHTRTPWDRCEHTRRHTYMHRTHTQRVYTYSSYIAYVRACVCVSSPSLALSLYAATLYRGWENGWRRHICGSVGSEGNHEWRERQPVDKRGNEAGETRGKRVERGERKRERER